jgi:hypothetical protein
LKDDEGPAGTGKGSIADILSPISCGKNKSYKEYYRSAFTELTLFAWCAIF